MNNGYPDLIEDAAVAAARQFQLAQQHCGDCRAYHAMWSYVQLAGLRNKGLALDRKWLEPLIARHAPPKSRIMIAGAADAASLALTRSATGGNMAEIAVADRCETPLAVCRAYALEHQFALTALQVDIAESRPVGNYDCVFAHLVLMFVPAARRVGFLRNLGLCLGERGRLLLVHRRREGKRAPNRESEKRLFAERVLSGLSERGIPLPSDAASVQQDLEDYCTALHKRRNDPIGFEDVAEYLAASGFRISECVDYRRPTPLVADDASKSQGTQTRIFVAQL
jgi:hypothetical protein